MNDLDRFERDQAFVHELVEQRNEFANLFLGVDDLDENRQVGRKIENPGRVHDRVSAEAFDAFEDRRTAQASSASGFDDCGIERLRTAPVALADENAQ